MATASEEALRAIFEQIRDERKTHANTATRIGDAFLSLLSHLDNGTFLKQGDTESTEYILSVTGGASASLTKLFTLETVTEQGEERVTLATPLAPFKELELRDYLQIGDARLRWDSERQALYVIGKDGSTPVGFYSTGWLSAKGANDTQGEGGGGGGLSYSRLDSWEGYSDEEKGGWVLSAYLGVRLHQDIENLKSGVAMSYAVTGTGNAITDVTRDGSRWVFTRGKTFSELGHTHTLSDISNLHSSWDAILKVAPSDYVTRWPTAAEVGALTQATADSRYALKTVTISAGAGLTGGGNLSANRTLSLAAVGTAGTYTKVTVDAYGRVTAHASLSATDIPTLSISKISGLQAALDAKLPAATFDELFEKVTLSTGETAIRAKLGLYSDKWVSAKGANPSAGEGGGGISYSRLDTWEGYTDEEKGGWVLSAYLGVRLHQDIENLKSGVAMSYAVTGTGNAITDVTRDGSRWVFTKGKTFSELWHTHTLSDISDLNSSWDSLLKEAPSAYITRWPSWTEVKDKPSTFTPSSHKHVKADITDFPTTWAWSAISGKPTTFTPSAHQHPLSDLSDLHSSWDAILKAAPFAGVSRWPSWSEVTGKPTSFTPSSHTHAISQVSGLQAALDAKLPAATFDELFEKVTLSTGETAIRAKFGLYSDKWLSAKGANPNQGEGGGFAYTRLDTWEGYDSATMDGWVLSAKLGYSLYNDVKSLKAGAAVSFTIEGTGNAITDISKDGTRLVFTRGTTFALSSHQHLLSNISDLNSGWDSLLKTAPSSYVTRWPSWSEVSGKPTTFTPASHTHTISQVSDLHASWDALLKAAPSAYVTRWPSIGEVTGKQSLAIKLNGGGTEGTSLFTYNGTAAKTVNITAAAIGAAASSHTHPKSQITDFPTTWAWSAISGKPTTLGGYGITDAYTKSQGDARYLLLTGNNTQTLTGGNGNTVGWRLVTTKTCGAWTTCHMVFAVAARHGGVGIISIDFEVSSVISSYSYNICYNGVISEVDGDSWLAYYNTSTGVFRLFWKYRDYSPSYVTVLSRGGFNAITNGTWYETLPSDVGTKLTIYYNEAKNANYLGGTSKGGLLTALSSSSGTNLSLTVGGTKKTVADLYATTAEKLLTARTINGTSFNGTANIVTSYWGTARNISIASSNGGGAGSAVSVNGSANVTLKLPATITAALSGNASTATKLATARTLWGRSFDGSANVSGDLSGVGNISASGVFSTSKFTGTHLAGNQGQALVNSTARAGAYVMLHRGCSTNGYFTLGTYQGTYLLQYTAKSTVTAGNNSVTKSVTLLNEAGNSIFPGTLHAVLLHASGGIYSDQYVSAKGQNTSSDMRLKDVLGDVTLPLERIAKAPSFEFRWRDGSGESAGSSAQYWRDVIPSAVNERGGWLEMQYGNIALLSAIAIARETMRVDREVARLREECRRLRRRVARLEGAAGTRRLTAT